MDTIPITSLLLGSMMRCATAYSMFLIGKSFTIDVLSIRYDSAMSGMFSSCTGTTRFLSSAAVVVCTSCSFFDMFEGNFFFI